MRKNLFKAIIMGVLIIASCSKDDSSDDQSNNNNSNPLNWLEEEAAHKWGRYHSYDGSYMYYILNADRTACYFEITSSGSRVENKCYTNWRISESSTKTIDGQTAYALTIDGSGLTSYFSYVNNKIYKGGYSNLAMSPSTTSKSCECN